LHTFDHSFDKEITVTRAFNDMLNIVYAHTLCFNVLWGLSINAIDP